MSPKSKSNSDLLLESYKFRDPRCSLLKDWIMTLSETSSEKLSCLENEIEKAIDEHEACHEMEGFYTSYLCLALCLIMT